MTNKVRLFVDHSLGHAQSVPLDRDQAHYLFGVMRLSAGDIISIFNGTDGQWSAIIDTATKRGGSLICQKQTKTQQNPPDLWLLFAPIKKARTDFIVEKATELGVAAIHPVQTEFTNSERIRQERLQAHAIEAAEQCGGTFVPPVHGLKKLNDLITKWPTDRNLLFCDESLVGSSSQFASLPKGKWAVLIGPEGGFSQDERNSLRSMNQSYSVSLGPRILRADTAAVTALSLWQNYLGDWHI